MLLFEIKTYTDNPRQLKMGIVFTGGGSQITHLRELVKLKTGMDVKIGKPLYVSENSPKEVVHPRYSTAVGLIMCGFDSKIEEVNHFDDCNIEDKIKIENKIDSKTEDNNENIDDIMDEENKTPLKSFIKMIKNVLYEQKEEI